MLIYEALAFILKRENRQNFTLQQKSKTLTPHAWLYFFAVWLLAIPLG